MELQVAGVVHEASSGVPTINTGTRKDVPTYHVLRKEDGEMCTRMDLQVGTASEISLRITSRTRSTVRLSTLPLLQPRPRIHHPALSRRPTEIRHQHTRQTDVRRAILLHPRLVETQHETAQGGTLGLGTRLDTGETSGGQGIPDAQAGRAGKGRNGECRCVPRGGDPDG